MYAPSDNAEETISEVDSISEILGGEFSGRVSLPKTAKTLKKKTEGFTTPTHSNINNKENIKR